MKPTFINDFERNEWLGRQALLELQQLYPNTFKYQIHLTEYEYESYDAHFFVYDKITGKLKKRIIIEIKYRHTDYPDYMLEQKKIKSLHKSMKDASIMEGEYSLYYLNFTPTKTYLWDITDIKPEDCKDTLYANKATAISRTNKTNKNCILLKPEDAKEFKFILDEKRIEDKWSQTYVLPKLEKKMKEPGFNLDELLNKI